MSFINRELDGGVLLIDKKLAELENDTKYISFLKLTELENNADCISLSKPSLLVNNFFNITRTRKEKPHQPIS